MTNLPYKAPVVCPIMYSFIKIFISNPGNTETPYVKQNQHIIEDMVKCLIYHIDEDCFILNALVVFIHYNTY